MIIDTQISLAISKFVDASYALGDVKNGWDCLNIILSFYRELRYKFPDSFEGIDESNYVDLWNKDETVAREVFTRFLRSLGYPVDFNYARRADLLLFSSKTAPMFPVIYLGNGNVLMNWGTVAGIKVCPMPELLRRLSFGLREEIVKEARRLI